MRILIIGFIVLVIWFIVSAWLYNDKLVPVMKKPFPMQKVPEAQAPEEGSLMKL